MTKTKERTLRVTASQTLPDKVESEHIRNIIVKERLFDARWYAAKYKIEFSSSEQAEEEFLKVGALAGRDPNPLFSTEFYRKRYGLNGNAIPFFHYINEGLQNDHWPHPIVDAVFVRNQLTKLGVTDSVLSALLHKCSALRLSPHAAFSVPFYLSRYPELAARRVHPVIHYLTYGARELRAPHPLFWPKWTTRDSKVGTYACLLDYLREPEAGNLSPNPYFSPASYYAQHPDVEAAGFNALSHYLAYGQHEVRIPNVAVDPEWVQKRHGDAIRATGLDPLSFLIIYQNRFVTGNPEGKALATIGDVTDGDLSRLRSEQFGAAPAPTSSKRILFVSHNLRLQGAQTSLFELACGLHGRLGHNVSVYAPDQGPLKERYQAEGITVSEYKLPMLGLPDDKHYQKLLKALQKDIATLRPDLIHGNTIQSYHLIAVAARLGIPAVWNIRESEEPKSHFENLHAGANSLLVEAINSPARFAFVASSTERLWRNTYPNITSVCIRNGIDHARLQPSAKRLGRNMARGLLGFGEQEVALLNVGTWTERKGQLDIIRALPLIDRRFWARIRVILIGSNKSAYSQQILQELEVLPLALQTRVRIFQETKNEQDRVNVLTAYRGSDVFLFSSRIESYPRVVNEALYFGLPVISVPCFGAVEQIQEAKCGFFYEAGDVNGLAHHIESLVGDAALRREMQIEAIKRSRVDLTQYDEMLKQYDELYTSLLKSVAKQDFHANAKSLA